MKVLFVCIHNSARSQMAEAFLNILGEGKYKAESAGIEPGKLNPVVVEAMKEIGIDISQNKTTAVSEVLNNNYDLVVTVCDEASAERCPMFPGKVERAHWGFEDPSSLKGTHEEKLIHTRGIRDMIKQRIEDFINEKSL